MVTFNGEGWVDYCFKSLLLSTIPLDILCIDNDSHDATTSLIEKKYPTVELIRNNQNLGFGKANNLGLRKSICEDYEYTFLLNQDARVEPEAIAQLIAAQKRSPQFGILSPLHRSFEGTELDSAFSSCLDSTRTENILSDCLLGAELLEVYSTKFVNAAIWLISRDCLRETGIFDPDFPHYGEDTEYVYRAKKSGFSIGIVPAAYGNHARYKVATSDKQRDFRSDANRKFVEILADYKCRENSPLRKNIYYSRRMLSELFFYTIMVDIRMLKLTFRVYWKLFLTIHQSDHSIES